MKRLVLFFLLLILLALAAPLSAHSREKASELEYKKKGFFLGGELAGLMSFDFDNDTVGAPGKLDLLLGYQINPFVSVAADLWTFLCLAWAAEAHVKANFIDSKISPYAVMTAGVVGVVPLESDSATGPIFTYSAGLGGDFHLWRKGTLFAEAKYRGGVNAGAADQNNIAHGIEIGAGFRWLF